MSIASQILQSLAQACDNTRLPTVRALHLPPSPWNEHRDGEFGALELDDGSLGLSYVLLDNTLAKLTGADNSGLVGLDVLEVANWWTTQTGTRSTIGFAAVNALSRHLFDRAGFVPPKAGDSIADLNPQPNEHIGMVGFFPPLLKRVTDIHTRLTILELKAELAGEKDGYRVTLDPTELETCNKILSTSTVLLNHTIDDLLMHCTNASDIALIGPGAGCLPDALFRNGITVLGGTWIFDGPGFVDALTNGQPWGKNFADKFALHKHQYPGLGLH